MEFVQVLACKVTADVIVPPVAEAASALLVCAAMLLAGCCNRADQHPTRGSQPYLVWTNYFGGNGKPWLGPAH